MTAHTPHIWSEARLSPSQAEEASDRPEQEIFDSRGHRTRFEQDYDRILFSTPVRRLSDKTQVFPLDRNDAVRTRLTHSHEVANLSRSMGAKIMRRLPEVFDKRDADHIIGPILGAIGLAHDLGNAPFGHQGEAAIAEWFRQKKTWIFDRKEEKSGEIEAVPLKHRAEFFSFDGNPQSLRLLTRLQTSRGKVGLNLTAATIMASIKYPVSAEGIPRKHAAKKKFGYFASEADVVEWARYETGLEEGQRHPLTWIMEAADDIAYSILDVEDAMKKGIVSPDDLLNILKCDDSVCTTMTFERIRDDFQGVEHSGRLPSIIRDIKIGYLRSHLTGDLINHATEKYIESRNEIFDYTLSEALMDDSNLCNRLKNVAREYAFGNSEVLYVESKGRRALEELLDAFWRAIVDRQEDDNIDSGRTAAFSRYVFSLISPNYLEAALDVEHVRNPVARVLRYREMRLLTDMVAGMTDSFSISLAEKIRSSTLSG